jgi:hypothetical protein
MTGLRGPARVGRNEGLIEAPVILNRVLRLVSGALTTFVALKPGENMINFCDQSRGFARNAVGRARQSHHR